MTTEAPRPIPPRPSNVNDRPRAAEQPTIEPATTRSQITIHARLDGFTFDVAFEGKIEQLPAYLDRLRSAGATPASAAEWSYTPEGLPICPKHGAPMKKREKQGDAWYSHVVTAANGDDVYCKGYHGKDSPGFEC